MQPRPGPRELGDRPGVLVRSQYVDHDPVERLVQRRHHRAGVARRGVEFEDRCHGAMLVEHAFEHQCQSQAVDDPARPDNRCRRRPPAVDNAGMSPPETDPPAPRWTESTVFPDMWVDPDDDPRETEVDSSDERAVLLDYLRYYRLTFQMKCAGLDAEQLARRSVPPSTMSLLGLIRHLAEDERHMRRVMAGEDAPKVYATEEDRDGDWNGAVADPAVVDDAWQRWRVEVDATDRLVAGIPDLGTMNAGVSDLGPDGADLPLRDMLVAQIAEYARHCGHADLLRERIDGRVGQ